MLLNGILTKKSQYYSLLAVCVFIALAFFVYLPNGRAAGQSSPVRLSQVNTTQSASEQVEASPAPTFPADAGPFPGYATLSEDIDLALPKASELLPVSPKLPPIKLEASYNRPVGLREILQFSLLHNLAINISKANWSAQKWLFGRALGAFLPDVIMNYRSQYLDGATLIGGVVPVSFATPNVQANAGLRVWGFQGGRVLFGSLKSMHDMKAAGAQVKGTTNDVLLQVAQAYYELQRSQAILQIQVRAVDTSKAQLTLNQQLEAAGTGTRFNVLQSDTQLARDEQNLLSAEVAFRIAAINLARLLNIDLGVNLMSLEATVKRVRLIDPSLDINDLMKLAAQYRPELKQYEEQRLAARRNMQVAAAPLYPTLQFNANVAGNGVTLSRTYAIVPAQLNTVPLSGPPNPTGAVVNLGTGSVDNSTLTFDPSIPASRQLYPIAGQITPAQRLSRQMRKSYAIGFQIDWNYFSLGVPDLANVQAARAVSRQALLQLNQQFMNVLQEVRTSYLNSLIAERQIDVTTRAVASSSEQLRLARVRLANGVGTNIDVIQAQQAWTQALINKAEAILQFNKAQAQLVHDIGLISVETLASGKLLSKQGT